MDLGVRPQHQMLWGEDIGPETDVDNPELPRDSRVVSGQNDVVDVSSDSDEEEWKYVKGATKSEDKKQGNPVRDDNKSQLNPNATEFVPGFPSVEKEEFIAESPNVHKTENKSLDDIEVPSETEFDKDISSRACDLDPATDIDPFNTSVDTSRVEERTSHRATDPNESDGVSLFLTPQKDVLPKIESTNPFSPENELKHGQTDQVDFVQDYFGKSELDFKPFDSPASHHAPTDSKRNRPVISNAVSDETAHIGPLESHLNRAVSARADESEKERNQLEIKEPESPVNTEGYGSGVIEHSTYSQQVPLVCQPSESDLDPSNLSESHSNVPAESEKSVLISRENIKESDEINVDDSDDNGMNAERISKFASKNDSLPNAKDDDTDVIIEKPHQSSGVDFLAICKDKNVSDFVGFNEKNQKEGLINNSVEDALQDAPKADSLELEAVGVGYSVEHPDDISPATLSDDEDKIINHVEQLINSVIQVNSDDRVNENELDKKARGYEVSNPNLIEDEIQNDSRADKRPTEVTTDNVGLGEPEMELADTIGPSAFSFSQPYEGHLQTNVTPMDFIGFRKNDIMTTSMHESLEPDSSFEFITESTINDSGLPVIDSNLANKGNLFVTEAVCKPTLESNKTVENGVVDLESSHNALSSKPFEQIKIAEVTSAGETESAIVESHEVPVSSEPDLIFVEQICPTVEVSSEESSPVNKENASFVACAVGAAGITTALGACATVSSASNEKEKEVIPKEDVEPAEIKTANKTLSANTTVPKKPTSTSSARPISKTAASKSPLVKASSVPAKPKALAASKPTSSTATKAKPAVSSINRTSTASAAKLPPTTKQPAKPSATLNKTSTVKASVTSAAKPASGPIKAATRPTPTTTKSTTLSAKPPATAKTTAAFPKAPIAAKKPTSTAARPLVGSRPTSAIDSKPAAKLGTLRTSSLPAAKPSVTKTTGNVGAKPPTKLISAVTANKLKSVSSKPAPIKAKSPLSAPKRPSSAPNKKLSTVQDKNAKNTEKSAAEETAQKDIIVKEDRPAEDSVSSTTNGHHIENGNITPLEEIPSHII